MKLLIDLGSGSLKWCLSSDINAINRTSLDAFIETMQSFDDVEHAFISSVRNQDQTSTLVHFLKQRIDFVENLAPNKDILDSAYSNITHLGIDRWLCMVGAMEQAPCLVIDAGTAITIDYIDLIDNRPFHAGGWILPGHTLMLETLLNQTNLSEKPRDNSTFWGNDTQSCMYNGIENSYTAIINHAQTHTNTPIILTGGDASKLFNALSNQNNHRLNQMEEKPSLIFSGMLKTILFAN